VAETSFASLSPTLLARKGGAKPAMRPQHAALASMPDSPPEPEHLEEGADLPLDRMGRLFVLPIVRLLRLSRRPQAMFAVDADLHCRAHAELARGQAELRRQAARLRVQVDDRDGEGHRPVDASGNPGEGDGRHRRRGHRGRRDEAR